MPPDPSRWLLALVFEAWALSLLQIILPPCDITAGWPLVTVENVLLSIRKWDPPIFKIPINRLPYTLNFHTRFVYYMSLIWGDLYVLHCCNTCHTYVVYSA